MFLIDISMAAVVIEDRIIFSARNCNSLLETVISTGKTRLLSFFEEEDNIPSLHIRAFYFNGKIFFIPLYGNKIACFNNATKKVHYIGIPKRDDVGNDLNIFSENYNDKMIAPRYFDAGYIDDNKIYMIPARGDYVGILDMETEKISFKNIKDEYDREVMGYGTYFNGKLYIAPYYGKCIKCLNLENNKVTKFIKGSFGKYYGIQVVKDKLFFSATKNNSILYIELDNPVNISLGEEGTTIYREIVAIGEKMWLLPYNNETLSYVDYKNMKFYNMNENINRGTMTHIKSVNSNSYETGFISYTYNYFSLIEITGREHLINPQIDENTIFEICKYNYGEEIVNYLGKNGILEENEFGLRNFIKAL